MASKITQHKLTCTVAAGATSASAYTPTVVRGRILSAKVIFTNSTPLSSSDRDVDLYEMNPASTDVAKALQHILDIGGLGATPEDDNGTYYPRTPAQDYTGTDVTYDGTNEIYEPFLVFGKVHLNVTNAAEGDITTVYLEVEEF